MASSGTPGPSTSIRSGRKPGASWPRKRQSARRWQQPSPTRWKSPDRNWPRIPTRVRKCRWPGKPIVPQLRPLPLRLEIRGGSSWRSWRSWPAVSSSNVCYPGRIRPDIPARECPSDYASSEPRLGDIAVSVQPVGFENVFFGVGRGQDYDRYAHEVGIGLGLRQHFAAILFRQVEVEQDQVGPRCRGELALAPEVGHGFDAILDGVQMVPQVVRAQRLPGEPHVGRVVLYQ